jgi:phospholipid/cholesterol/gamma-HCH transport system substrate-binding protein
MWYGAAPQGTTRTARRILAMAQRKQLTWSELRVGLLVILGLAVTAVGIFYVTGAGFLGPKYKIFTYLPEVSGLATGAPVKLDGVVIGTVDQIQLVPHQHGKAPDRLHNIVVGMKIDKKYQADILTDSSATLVTEGLLGNRYVNIQRGYMGTPLKDGQEVPGADVGDVMANFKVLSAQIQDMLTDIRAGKGTLGKFVTDDQAYNNLNSLLLKGNQVVAGVQAGKGTLGKLVTNDELYVKVDKGVDQINTMLGDLREQKGTIGKLLYDPSLYDQAKKALENGNAVLDDARAGKGTLGKLLTDDTLYNKARDTATNLDTATAKLNKNDNTAGKLFSDPQLYDNLTNLTGEMRTMISDFRKNPKKYLSIKLSFF